MQGETNDRPPRITRVVSMFFFPHRRSWGLCPQEAVFLGCFLEMGPGHPKPGGVSREPLHGLSAGDCCRGWAPTSRELRRRQEEVLEPRSWRGA